MCKQVSDEDKEVAKNSPIIDPFNMKINNLGVKSRDNWLKKIQQAFDENLSSTTMSDSCDQPSDLCAQIEHGIFVSAKNLIIYQANCMKKINEVKKFTKECRSFLAEYMRLKREAEEATATETNKVESIEQLQTADMKKEVNLRPTSFTSALKMLKSEDSVIFLKIFMLSYKNKL